MAQAVALGLDFRVLRLPASAPTSTSRATSPPRRHQEALCVPLIRKQRPAHTTPIHESRFPVAPPETCDIGTNNGNNEKAGRRRIKLRDVRGYGPLRLSSQGRGPAVLKRAMALLREGVRLPTFAELAEPALIPKDVRGALGKIGPDDAAPAQPLSRALVQRR